MHLAPCLADGKISADGSGDGDVAARLVTCCRGTPPSIHGPHRQQQDVTMLSTTPTTPPPPPPPPQPTSEPPASRSPRPEVLQCATQPSSTSHSCKHTRNAIHSWHPTLASHSGMGPVFLVLRSSLGESDEARMLGFLSEPSSHPPNPELSWAPLGPTLYFYTRACALRHFSCV